MQNKHHNLYYRYRLPPYRLAPGSRRGCVGARRSVCTHTRRMSRSFPRSAVFIYFPDVFVVRCRDFVSGFWLNTFKVFSPNSRRTYTIYAQTSNSRAGVCVLFLAKSFWNKLVKNSHSTLSISRAVSKLFLRLNCRLSKGKIYSVWR